MQQSVPEPGFLILSVFPRRLSPQRLLSACGLEAACRCAKNPGLNSGGPQPVPFPFFHLLSWSIGLCKESRAQKPNSRFCSLTSLPYLLLTNRTRRERERNLTKTDPGTLKTVSTGLTLRRGGSNLRIYTATCTPDCNTCITGDSWPTLLLSLYSKTSRWAYEYWTSIFPLTIGPWSVLHCMKSLGPSRLCISKSRIVTTRWPGKYNLAFPAQRRDVCLDVSLWLWSFLVIVSTPSDQSSSEMFKLTQTVGAGVISSALPAIACFHLPCFCIPFSKHYLLQNNFEVSKTSIWW